MPPSVASFSSSASQLLGLFILFVIELAHAFHLPYVSEDEVTY